MKKYFYVIIVFCFSNNVFAQPAVRNEPRHHNVFENDYIRVLDVYLAPDDTTQYHIHATPSVFITPDFIQNLPNYYRKPLITNGRISILKCSA